MAEEKGWLASFWRGRDEEPKFRSNLDTPMMLVGSNPEKDPWVGQDELGRNIYEHSASGKKYVVAPTIEGKGLVGSAKDAYEAIPPLDEWEAPSYDEIMGTAKNLLSGVAEGVVEAVRAPSNPEASLGDVWNTAGAMAGGGVSASKGVPEGSQGMFVSVRDYSKVERAKDLLERGYSPQEVAMKEGIRMNPKGIWVEEISDKDFKINSNLRQDSERYKQPMQADMGWAIEHPELLSRYPTLRQSSLTMVPPEKTPQYLGADSVMGSHNPRTKEIRVRTDAPDDVVLHELQHAVQSREGWDSGANGPEIMNSVNATYDNLPPEGQKYLSELGHLARGIQELVEAEKIVANPPKNDWGSTGLTLSQAKQLVSEADGFIQDQLELLTPLRETNPDMAEALEELFGITRTSKVMPDEAFDIYQRNYGEWEARKTQDRKDLGDWERITTDPFEDAPKDSWTNADLRRALSKVDNAITKNRGQSTYADEMMSLPREYAEGGMIMDPEQEVPVGALPSEVADDVDIKASEGEYIIPANVVRYLGLEKIESLIEKAKKGLAEKEAQGRIGGDTSPEAPPDQSAQGLEAQMAEAMPKMAAGGLVQDNYTGVKEYQDASGSPIYVPFVNGQPSTNIPPGATLVNTPPGINSTPTPAPTVGTPKKEKSDGRSSQPGADNLDGTLAGSVDTWGAKQFGQYEKGFGSAGEKFGRNMVKATLGPIGGLAVKARDNYLRENVPTMLDKMIKTGVDPTGAKLSPEQVTDLTGVRERLAAKQAEQAKPTTAMGKIGKAVGAIRGLMNPMSAAATAVDLVQDVRTPAAAKTSPTASKKSDGRDGLGSSLGKSDKEQSRANAGMGNGGLYAKGGLVVQPTPMPQYMAKGGLITRKKK